MRIYGYTKDGKDLQKLVEVTFQSDPERLRQLGRFLMEMADGIENDRNNFGHGHAKDYCEDWQEDDPEVIVFEPAS